MLDVTSRISQKGPAARSRSKNLPGPSSILRDGAAIQVVPSDAAMAKKIGARMILYLYLAVFLTRIGFGSVTILFPLYLPAGAFQVGLILALYPIAEAVSAMPVGRLADRISRK